ncbi:CACTA en-spm transposon protein [Cucumis melo var. makuwa]|uniref:CACTA en-spm transposon protein n=1 Tax=Cucumis melo var. makuwa TaxID=1194695 RepID=A0A5A7SHW8_CUCMM|nr:CACTA en-spm transposon protein [Cucumis melo var. makuwa]
MESWFSYVQFSNERFSKCIWDVPKVKDVQDQQLNVLEIIGDHRVANDIVVDTLCRLDVDPTVMERPIDKTISLRIVRFSSTIGVLNQDTFPVRFLKWTDVTLEYIELAKGDLQEQLSMNRVDRANNPTTIVAASSRFYNNSRSLLNNEGCNRVRLGWVRRHFQLNPYFRVIWVGNPNNPIKFSTQPNPTRKIWVGLSGCRNLKAEETDEEDDHQMVVGR